MNEKPISITITLYGSAFAAMNFIDTINSLSSLYKFDIASSLDDPDEPPLHPPHNPDEWAEQRYTADGLSLIVDCPDCTNSLIYAGRDGDAAAIDLPANVWYCPTCKVHHVLRNEPDAVPIDEPPLHPPHNPDEWDDDEWDDDDWDDDDWDDDTANPSKVMI